MRTIVAGECWLWYGAYSTFGHGAIKYQGKTWQVHRLAWDLVHGVTLTPEVLIRHKCDDPRCWRPSHLQTGTTQDNVNDRVARGRSARGEANGRAKLKADDVRVIKERLKDGSTCGQLSLIYGVTHKAIRLIRDGVNWKHV